MTKEELKELRNEWEIKVSEFIASVQSQAAWCREKNINLRTFNYWYCKLKKDNNLQDRPTNWLSVKLEASVIKIKMGNAIIEINHGFDSEQLLKVIKILNSLC